MKKNLPIMAALFVSAQVSAQTTYDFGTGSQSAIAPLYSTGTTAAQWPLDAGSPYIPTSGMGTVGIVSRDNTAGNVQLVNSAITGLTGAYLKFTSATATINSKFGIYDHVEATNVATVKFKIHVPSTSATGTYVFSFGNGTYATEAHRGPNVAQNLVVLRFAIGTNVVINHWIAGSTNAYIGNDFIGGANTISKDATHTITIFMNNEATTQSYNASGTNTLTAGTYDVWVDGIKILAGKATAGLATGNSLKDMNFINSQTAATSSVVYFDDYTYSSALTPSVLPVTLSTPLTAKANGTSVQLNWATATEQNSDRFEILHSVNGTAFTKIGERTTTSASGANYSFAHYNAPAGNNYYKLVQVDKDGKTEEFAPVAVNVALVQTDVRVVLTNNSVTVTLNSKKAIKNLKLSVVDINGKVLAKTMVNVQEGNNTFDIPVSLASGLYLVNANGSDNWTKKVVKN